MLDVRRMRVLGEVARAGSIAAAAEALGYTPSAVSQHLARLEQETGVALVERTANSLRLTAAGQALARRTEHVLGELAAAEAEVRALGGADAGALRLGSFATAGATLVAEAILAIARMRPDLEVSFFEGDPEDTVPRLRRGEIDLALTYEYDFLAVGLDDGLRRELLLEEPVRLVLPRRHPAAARARPALADLAEERWIAEPRGDCRLFTAHACRAAGFEPRISCMCSDYRTTQSLVAAELGVALVPDLALAHPHPGVSVRSLAGPVPGRRIYATWRRSDSRRPLLRLALDALRGAAAARAGAPPAARGIGAAGVPSPQRLAKTAGRAVGSARLAPRHDPYTTERSRAAGASSRE